MLLTHPYRVMHIDAVSAVLRHSQRVGMHLWHGDVLRGGATAQQQHREHKAHDK